MSKLAFLKDMNKNAFLVGIAVIGIVVVGGVILAQKDMGSISLPFGNSNQKVADQGLKYINDVLLKGQSPASLVSVASESGLVKIKIKIGESEYDSYITKDGKFLFPTAYNMSENNNTGEQGEQQQTAKTCDDIKKSNKPVLEAYVVSQCPFGLQMQRVLADIVKNIPSMAENIKVRYMGAVSGNKITSMHGEEEADENLNQICIREEQASKYWNYVSCYMKKGDSAGCLTSTGIDKTKLNTCKTDPKKGVAYAKVDFDLNTKYGIEGSPTLVFGEEKVSEFDFGGRTSDGVKSLICCGFNSKPGSCSTQLNTKEAASSFSESYESTGGSTGDAGC